ncbi:MAG: hypothetical protein P4L46_10615 [Fimbriimonas sp.]|nr:hypothetical protein [Fimbriimonas sp.]
MSDAQPTKPTRRLHKTREEEADRCLNHTSFSPGSQAILAGFFLLIVFGIPLLQHVVEIRRNVDARQHWSPKGGEPEPKLLPQVYDVLSLLPSKERIDEAKGFWGYWSLIPSGESISAFETSLKENSILTKALLAPAQAAMSGTLGVGNEKAYCGRDGWLFYRPDVEYLTSDGFLDPKRLSSRARGATPIQPDPVVAILDLGSQLRERGISLVVVPVTTKPMIEPDMLAGPSAAGIELQNPSFGKFESALRAGGVTVFDPTPVLREEEASTGHRQYLTTDTHWTPEGLEAVAQGLAAILETKGMQPKTHSNAYSSKRQPVANVGDIAEMLKLPPGQTLFPKQEVLVRHVSNPDGSDWKPDRRADVLLLGDSFSNIYSVERMGWGRSAGLAEQLSYSLGRPVDTIAINAGGSFASRRALAQQLAQGVDRLAGKKVVVYEFSMRDLTEGDWKLIRLAHPAPTSQPVPPAPKQPAVNPQGPNTPSQTVVKPTQPANQATQVTTPVKPTAQPPTKPLTGTKPPVANPAKGLKPPANPPSHPAKSEGLVVAGRIVAKANAPKPGSVPYKDCLIALQISDLKVTGGNIKGPNIVVYVWGMKDNQLVDGAYSAGQTVTIKLVPWASVDSKYGGLNRQELDSDDSLSWEAFWGELNR